MSLNGATRSIFARQTMKDVVSFAQVSRFQGDPTRTNSIKVKFTTKNSTPNGFIKSIF